MAAAVEPIVDHRHRDPNTSSSVIIAISSVDPAEHERAPYHRCTAGHLVSIGRPTGASLEAVRGGQQAQLPLDESSGDNLGGSIQNVRDVKAVQDIYWAAEW